MHANSCLKVFNGKKPLGWILKWIMKLKISGSCGDLIP